MRCLGRFLAVAAAMWLARAGWGLQPDEVAVIVTGKSADSVAVGKHYLEARGIPAGNLVTIHCEPGETIGEEEFRTVVEPDIRKQLVDKKLDKKIKCLVTTYDVPLKIGPQGLDHGQWNDRNLYRLQSDAVMGDLEKAIGEFDAVLRDIRGGSGAGSGGERGGMGGSGAEKESSDAGKGGSDAATRGVAPGSRGDAPGGSGDAAAARAAGTQAAPEARTIEMLVPKLDAAARAAAARINARPMAERAAAVKELMRVQEKVAGIAGVLTSFHVEEDMPGADSGNAQMDALRARAAAADGRIAELQPRLLEPEARAESLKLSREAHGLLGEALELQNLIAVLEMRETEASFESELMLLWSDPKYARSRWLANPLNVSQWPTMKKSDLKVMMACRLDGAEAARAIAMIDRGIQVEKAGLDGKIYLDAKGAHGTDAYSAFDNDIREAGAWLKDNSTMPVVLDDKEALLEAKDCPDAALYCGWYQVRNYHDSCQWVPGAVGYHVASFEMVSLHRIGETGWVVNLLNRGFCGTLGAVDEPYLTAFPKPSQFFPLLMCGEFTQGEVWLVTAPSVSWRIGYVGDPLYNPFKAKPRVAVEKIRANVVLRNAFEILRTPAK